MHTQVSDVRRSKEGVYIGRPRANQDWRFGNPFRIGRDGGPGECTPKMRAWLLTGETFGCPDATPARRQWILANLHTLRGQTLLCWCNGAPHCHGHLLASLADR